VTPSLKYIIGKKASPSRKHSRKFNRPTEKGKDFEIFFLLELVVCL
jgi:hypothetical protein